MNLTDGPGKNLECDIIQELLNKEFRAIWIDPFLHKAIFCIKQILHVKNFFLLFLIDPLKDSESGNNEWYPCFAAKYVRGLFLKF